MHSCAIMQIKKSAGVYKRIYQLFRRSWREAARLEDKERDAFLFGRGLIVYFKFQLKVKLRVEMEEPSSSEFIENWMKVVKIAKMCSTTLSVELWIGERELEGTLALGVQRGLELTVEFHDNTRRSYVSIIPTYYICILHIFLFRFTLYHVT